MKFRIHKCVCNVNAVTNPTQTTQFHKYEIKPNKQKWVRNLVLWGGDAALVIVLSWALAIDPFLG